MEDDTVTRIDKTVDKALAADAGERKYFQRIYNHMGLGVFLTGLVSYFVMADEAFLNSLFSLDANGDIASISWWWGGAVVVELLLVLIISWKSLSGKMSAATATGLFYFYAALNGYTLTPLLYAYTATSAAAVFFIAASVFAAAAIWGYTTKKDLTKFGTFFFMALIGLLVAMVVNMFIGGTLMSMGISAFAVLLFTGLTAYDMQKLREMFHTMGGREDPERAGQLAAFGALTLYLDFINIFIHLLRLLGERK